MKQRKGFAVMSLEDRSRIARLGGIKAHKTGKAHQWTPEEASAAGRRGGKESQRRRAASRGKR